MKRLLPNLASPLQILRALGFRLRANDPHDLVPDIIDRQVVRQEKSLRVTLRGAVTIERSVEGLGLDFHAALNDQQTHGIIDAAEARVIARGLTRTKSHTYTHRRQIESQVV